MGFGTGLNALLTLRYAAIKIIYEAVEAFPLEKELVGSFNYEMIDTPWNSTVSIKKKQGPPAKREMLRATKQTNS